MMSIEEGIFWDEHWVLYGNQFDNKFHILKKKKKEKVYKYPQSSSLPLRWWSRSTARLQHVPAPRVPSRTALQLP